MIKTQIFYFSGTGNSLYVAKELQKRLPQSTLISINTILDLHEIKSEGDFVGFVFPIHAFTLPIPVKKFLEALNLESASYVFAVATRGGSPCNVFLDINKILKGKGKALNSSFFVDMPNNFTHIVETPNKVSIDNLNTKAIEKLEMIKDIIVNNKKYEENDTNKAWLRRNIIFPLLSTIISKTSYFNTEKKFYVDSNCSECGICSKICLSNKISIRNNKPYWRDDISCIYCFACINYCPCRSIQIRRTKSHIKGRYHHPEININDIEVQKNNCE
ncbi:hypothetical protein CLPUN_29440 [Clostridium puniceum]|uniref:4Fe-4S ferredoxin-type domain-containing protein n=1 Tax=Clostridium puniceum TaxID=29367 RepID=A0A1S8TDK8_9CLOT|nr:EFR1 family ferrodoxin [Clostridium puniceum]OOM75907.1 hypothetical protein CLPUN_29440 [Clostridium puniceum]